MHVHLSCPKCSSTLIEEGPKIHCKNCESVWPVINGIPRFTNGTYYWGEIPFELMQRVNVCASQSHWRNSLEELVRPHYPDIYDYVISNSRADFNYFIPLNSKSIVLDVGSGWGTISLLLADRSGHVISVESVKERIEFQRIRTRQDEINNVQLIQANFLDLPIPKSGLDLVVMNGVLEWIGIASTYDTPPNLQKKVLRKVFDSLKPGGTLYIGIENRFGYNYFLGGRDHSDIPFTSLMPRWLANQVMKWKTQSSRRTEQASGAYRTYTYSYWGYKSLLAEIGFSAVDIYLVFPDYNLPAYLVPAGNYRAFSYMVKQMYSGGSINRRFMATCAGVFAPFGLQKLFAPSFSIFAHKTSA